MAGVLCSTVHPIDEIYCAGLLAHLAHNNVPVHLLSFTRAEGACLGNPPFTTRAKLGPQREAEMRQSGSILGATTVQFLDYIDPVFEDEMIAKAPEYEPAVIQEQIIQVVENLKPELVITHGSNGEYGHPGHVMGGKCTHDAIMALGQEAPLLYSFNANCADLSQGMLGGINTRDPLHFRIDVSKYMEQKEMALRCYESIGISVEDVATANIETYSRQFPRVNRVPDDIMKEWCRTI